ncbi:hypothetical protein ACHAWF_004116, partial [Thalassiosira exigua]
KSVAVYGTTVVVGALENDSQRGAVFVFVRDASGEWSQQAKLQAPDGVARDLFGSSVAVHHKTIVVGADDTAIVGALSDADNGPKSGSAHVFVRKGVLWTHQAKLVVPDGDEGDVFGGSVGVYGDTVVVGTNADDHNGVDSGSVHIFVQNGVEWYHQEKLLAPDGAANDFFGTNVGIYKNTVVASSSNDDDLGSNSGSAHVFVRTGAEWSHEAKLVAPDGVVQDIFGWSVAIHGDTIIVGARWDDIGDQIGSGSTYLFVRKGETWIHQAKLLAPDRDAYDYFGASVGIHDDTAIVGAWADDDKGSRSGSAHVFVRIAETWFHQAKLVAPDGDEGDTFGNSVGVYVDTIVVGADADDHNGVDSGSAHIYVRLGSTWSHQKKLLAPDGSANDRFGDVGIYDNTVVVGAANDDDHGSNSGSARVYVQNGAEWSHQAKLVSPDAYAGDVFGNSVGVDRDTIVVGAWGDNVDGLLNVGSAHVYVRNEGAWVCQAKLLAPVRAAGDECGLRIAAYDGTAMFGCYGKNKTYLFSI